MTIKKAITELDLTENPVAKLLHAGIAFRVIVLAFKKNMVLKDNKTIVPTKLIVINGKVKFTINGTNNIIDTYEEQVIPLEEINSIEALEDSLCLLIQGYRA